MLFLSNGLIDFDNKVRVDGVEFDEDIVVRFGGCPCLGLGPCGQL